MAILWGRNATTLAWAHKTNIDTLTGHHENGVYIFSVKQNLLETKRNSAGSWQKGENGENLGGGWPKTVEELFLIPGIVITALMLLDCRFQGSRLSTKLEFPFYGGVKYST